MKKSSSLLHLSVPILLAGGLTWLPATLQAGVLAYEGFDYAAGSALNGQNGGLGWEGAWSVIHPNGGSLTLTASSLVADVNAPAGYDGLSTGQSVNLVSNFRGGRNLDTAPGGAFDLAGYIDGNGLIGADGTTLYFSFIQQPNGTGSFYEFELHRGDLGDGGRIGGIGNDQGGDNVNLRAPGNTHTPIAAGNTGVNFYIVRIDFQEGDDDIRVYMNPTTATEPVEATLALTGQGDLSFNGISLGCFLNSREVVHDELRFGQTWADMVAGVTNPPVVPEIAVQPHPVTSYAGGTVALSAVVTGSPAPALQWFRGDTLLAGQTTAELVLPNIQAAAAGNYKLVATNPSGTIATDPTPVNVLPLPQGLLAYEGFDYPSGTGNLGGQKGGLGWGAAWQLVDNGSHDVGSGSLAAGTNGPAGFDSYSLGNQVILPTNRRDGRLLDTTPEGPFSTGGWLDSLGNIGADNRTIYVSFLQQPNGTALFYELEFHRGSLGDPGRIAGIGNDQAGDNVHLRAPAGTHTPVGPGSTEVNFYVVRIDFKDGNDDIYVYQNPTGDWEPAMASLMMADQADMSFNGLSMGAFVNGRTVAHDEIRIGESWASVTNSMAVSPYAQWLTGFTFAPGADTTPAGDPDSDGLRNLLEFAFGTNPTVTAGSQITVAAGALTQRGAPAIAVTNGADFRAIFGRRQDFAAAGLTYTVQFTADLLTWQNSTAVPAIVASDAGMDAVSVPYPASVPTANGTAVPRFFRVVVTGG